MERTSPIRETKPQVIKQKGKPRQRSKNFIAFCEQRLQRVTGSKPSKGTNALPPTWQSFLSWGGAAAYKGHQVLGRHFGRATRKAREAISRPHGSEGMPFSQAFFWLLLHQDLAGAKLADSTLGRHLSKSFHVADEDGAQNDGETWHRPRARDASPSLQAGGHHRSRPSMGPMFFCIRPLQHSPVARKYSSSLKPKYFGPPSPGVGHGKWEETLQVKGRLGARAGKLERKGSPWTPIYTPIGR